MTLISDKSSECLNESDEHPFSHCLKPDNRFLESDCDEQLIIALAFKQPIKLHTLQIVGRNDGLFSNNTEKNHSLYSLSSTS